MEWFEVFITIVKLIGFYGLWFMVQLVAAAGLIKVIYNTEFSLKKALIFNIIMFVIGIVITVTLGFLIGFSFPSLG